MELEIEEKLNSIYNHIVIEVCYMEFRLYNIHLFDMNDINISFNYKWDCHLTFDSNIDIIKNTIDRCILDYFHYRR